MHRKRGHAVTQAQAIPVGSEWPTENAPEERVLGSRVPALHGDLGSPQEVLGGIKSKGSQEPGRSTNEADRCHQQESVGTTAVRDCITHPQA